MAGLLHEAVNKQLLNTRISVGYTLSYVGMKLIKTSPKIEHLNDLNSTQIQPRKYVLDHAEFTFFTRQHELDNTDPTDQE